MAGTNGEDDISSHTRNAGSRLLRGEGVLFMRFLLIRGWSRQGGRGKSSVDVDLARLHGSARSPR